MKQVFHYKLKGATCRSCELLIERELKEVPGVEKVQAKANKGEVRIETSSPSPTLAELNQALADTHYRLSEEKETEEKSNLTQSLILSLIIISTLWIISRLNILPDFNIATNSYSLPLVLGLGLVAGVSTCAALVGGLVLSLSKTWSGLSDSKDSTARKMTPHFLFNLGRTISYSLAGFLLGSLGSYFSLNSKFSSLIVILASLLMLILGLQMVGVKAVSKFSLSLPKKFTHSVVKKREAKKPWLPLTLGAATILLPCGFTLTAETIALMTGSAWTGALIMFTFALGTLPSLLVIGFTSTKLSTNRAGGKMFSQVAGFLVIFFSLYYLNAQAIVLGLPNFKSLSSLVSQASNSNTGSGFKAAGNSTKPLNGEATLENGYQVLKTSASNYGYSPDYLKVKAGIPVRWEITNDGVSGCTNAVIAPDLFEGPIILAGQEKMVKEFTPTKPGRYVFSCWMGMVTGIIEVTN